MRERTLQRSTVAGIPEASASSGTNGVNAVSATRPATLDVRIMKPIPELRSRTADEFERLAHDWVLAFNSRDESALQRLNEFYERAFSFDDVWAEIWRRVYAFTRRDRRRLRGAEPFEDDRIHLGPSPMQGSSSWRVCHASARCTSTGCPASRWTARACSRRRCA